MNIEYYHKIYHISLYLSTETRLRFLKFVQIWKRYRFPVANNGEN